MAELATNPVRELGFCYMLSAPTLADNKVKIFGLYRF